MSCDCITINNGGSDGTDGIYGGYSTDWIFDSASTISGVTSKYLRLNNTTVSAVTVIYVSIKNSDNVNVSSFLDSFSGGGVYGKLRIFDERDNTKFALFTVTAVTSPSGTERAVEVTYIAGNGSFTGGSNIVMSFTPKGTTGSAGAAGAAGSNGTNGTNGTNGLYGGFSLPWKFETSTAAGATSGYLRLNNGTYANVDTLYIHATNSDSIASSAFLDAFDNGGLYGYIKIAKKTDGTKFWMGSIESVAAGAYYTVSVSYIFANSTFSANDELFVTFTPGINVNSTFLFVGKLPSVAKVAGFELSDGQKMVPGTTGGDISVLEDSLSAFDSTTGVWTCPATGYYDMNFLINCNQNGADLGTGFYFAGIADSASGNTIAAYDTKTLATNMREGILQSTYSYRKLTAGATYAIWFLNRSNTDITGNANAAGGNASQSFHFSIKRVA